MNFYDLGRKIAKKYISDIISVNFSSYTDIKGIPLVLGGTDITPKFNLLTESVKYLASENFYEMLKGFAEFSYNKILETKDNRFYGYNKDAIKLIFFRLALLDGYFSTSEKIPDCCTNFFISKKIIGGNLDLNKDRGRENIIFRLNRPPKPFYKSFSITLKFLIGSIMGYNSNGIGIIYNSLKPKPQRLYSELYNEYISIQRESKKKKFLKKNAGFPPSLILQKVLNESKTIKDAYKISKKTPSISGLSFLIFKNKKAIVFEKSSSRDIIKMGKRKSNDFLVNTNHTVNGLPNAITQEDYFFSGKRYNYVYNKINEKKNLVEEANLINEMKGVLKHHFEEIQKLNSDKDKTKNIKIKTGICRHCGDIETIFSMFLNLGNKEFYWYKGSPCLSDKYLSSKL